MHNQNIQHLIDFFLPLTTATQTTIYFILIIYLLVKSSPFIYITVIPLSHTRWLVPLPNINERAKTVTTVADVIT